MDRCSECAYITVFFFEKKRRRREIIWEKKCEKLFGKSSGLVDSYFSVDVSKLIWTRLLSWKEVGC